MATSAHVLVTGIIRSGTTWVGRVLDSGPNTIYLHEPFNPDSPWNAAFPTPTNHLYLNHNNGQLHEYRMRQLLALTPLIRGQWLDQVRRERQSYIANAREKKRTEDLRCILKDPIAMYSAEWLQQKFGIAPVVVTRHPIAITKSIHKLGWGENFNRNFLLRQPELMERFYSDLAPTDASYFDVDWTKLSILDRTALLVRIFLLALRDYRQTHPDWIFVSYEMLQRDPELAFGELLSRLGLELYPNKADQIFRSGEGVYDPDRAHQRELAAVPAQEPFAPTRASEDWAGIYEMYFADLAPAFADLCDWSR